MASSPTRAPSPAAARYFLPFHWREAALCAPTMPVLVLIGVAAGYPAMGATAAGAALAVGLGAARQLKGQRWGAMGAAALGMSLAAFAGSLLGQDFALYVALAGLAAAACAAAALYDEDVWWAVLQIVIAYFIAGYYAGPWAESVTRGAVVLAAGAVQIGIVRMLAMLFPAAAAPIIMRPAPAAVSAGLRRAHMARAAICVIASLLITRRLGLSNSYWAPMTALIVLKPRLHETHARGLARLTGTVAGCAVATGYAHLCSGSEWLLGAGMTAAATAAYALQKAHYAMLTAAITATVVLLLSLGHAPALANAEHRIVATLIGGAIALAVAWVVPHGRRLGFGRVDRVGT